MKNCYFKNPNGEDLLCYLRNTLVNFIFESIEISIFGAKSKFYKAIVFLFKKGSEGEWIR
jgi:hypothetical protein